MDTGSYSSSISTGPGTAGYGIAGGWGNLNLPFQVFVKVFRPVLSGVAMVNGWGGIIGGYGTGLSAYIGPTVNSSAVSDFELCRDICRVAPAGTIVWTSIYP